MKTKLYLILIMLFTFGCEDEDDKNTSNTSGIYENCFDGVGSQVEYGPCATCGYYESESQGEADCITCPDGYEIDVYYEDCTGYCVEAGTANNPLSSSDCEAPDSN